MAGKSVTTTHLFQSAAAASPTSPVPDPSLIVPSVGTFSKRIRSSSNLLNGQWFLDLVAVN